MNDLSSRTKNTKWVTGVTQYNVTGDDDVLNVDTSSNAVLIILPNISNAGLDLFPRKIYINDLSNNAGTNNITIASVGCNVNGGASTAIDTNNGTAECEISGNTDWLVNKSTDGQSSGGFSITNITKAALLILFNAGTMTPGYYRITDARSVDNGIVLKANSATSLDEFGDAIFLNPDYQNEGVYPSNLFTNLGIWKTTLTPSLFVECTCWNGQNWVYAGSGGNDEPGVGSDWNQLQRADQLLGSPQGYIEVTNRVGYDLTNDWLFYREDEFGNKFSYSKKTDDTYFQSAFSQIESFQWGRAAWYNNIMNDGIITGLSTSIEYFNNTLSQYAQLSGNIATDSNSSAARINNNTLLMYANITGCTLSPTAKIYNNFIGINAAIYSCVLDVTSSIYANDLSQSASMSAITLGDNSAVFQNTLLNEANFSGINCTTTCAIYENVLGPQAQFNGFTCLDAVSIQGNVLGSAAIFVTFTMAQSSSVSLNILGSEAQISTLDLSNSAYVSSNKLDAGAYFVTLTISNSGYVYKNELAANAYFDTIVLAIGDGFSATIKNNKLGSLAYISTVTLTGGETTTISYNELAPQAYISVIPAMQDGAYISLNKLGAGSSITDLTGIEPGCSIDSNILGALSTLSKFDFRHNGTSGYQSSFTGNVLGSNCTVREITISPGLSVPGQFNNNTFPDGILFRRKTLDNNVTFVGNYVGISTASVETYSSNITGKTCRPGYSNFTLNLDMSDSSVFSGGVITIPGKGSYCGVFTLTNNSGQTITTILSLPTTHVSRFYVASGNTQSFQHTAIASVAVAGAMVSDTALTNTLTGRSTVSDWIEYAKAGNFNDRQNISIKA